MTILVEFWSRESGDRSQAWQFIQADVASRRGLIQPLGKRNRVGVQLTNEPAKCKPFYTF